MIISVITVIMSKCLVLACVRQSRIDSRFKWHGGKYNFGVFSSPLFPAYQKFVQPFRLFRDPRQRLCHTGSVNFKGPLVYTFRTATIASEFSVFHFIQLKLCAEGEKRAWDIFKCFSRFVAFCVTARNMVAKKKRTTKM